MQTCNRQIEVNSTRWLQQLWRWRYSRTWWNTSSTSQSHELGMAEHKACSVSARRWGLGWIASWVWTVICYRMWLYGTPGTTPTTTCYWGDSESLSWSSINVTSGCARSSNSIPLKFRPVRTSSLPPLGRRFPRHHREKLCTPHEYHRIPDRSWMPEFPFGDL